VSRARPAATLQPDERDITEGSYPWLRNPGAIFALVTGTLLAGAGLLFSRAELVLVAAPLIVSSAWAHQRRPKSDAEVRVRTTIGPHTASGVVGYRVAIDAPNETDAVIVRLFERGLTRSELVVDRRTAADLIGQVLVVHSGVQEIVRVDFALVGPQASVITAPARGPRSRRLIAPAILSLRRTPLPFRMFGLSGGHDSARPGDGGEFRDINQFAPGDRLRRIDWKVTARRAQAPGDLYVRRSFSTADATVIIVMDSRDEISVLATDLVHPETQRDLPTSLDVAREAAASLASGYIATGDRVGFRDLASSARTITPAGGSGHLHRVLGAIARTRPIGAPQRRLRAPIIPAGSLVYVLSTFLDGEAARMAEQWRVAGHRVVALDTLPPTSISRLRREQQAAVRIVQLEREARIRSLAALGADIVRWRPTEGRSPEVQLSTQSRMSRRPR
jgi:uncharacterized protein (DUF58 family)